MKTDITRNIDTIEKPDENSEVPIERTSLLQELEGYLRRWKDGVYIYGMPGIGKTTFLKQYIEKHKAQGNILYIDLLEFIVNILRKKETNWLSFIKRRLNDVNIHIDKIEDLNGSNLYSVIFDHIDSIDLSIIHELPRGTFQEIGQIIQRLTKHCSKLGIKMLFCSRVANHSQIEEYLLDEYYELKSSFDQATADELEIKIKEYCDFLILSRVGMYAMYLTGLKCDEIKQICEISFGKSTELCNKFSNFACAEKISHPLLISTWLYNLNILDQSNEYEGKFDELIKDSYIRSIPTFNNVYESIWKHSIHKSYKETLLALRYSTNIIDKKVSIENPVLIYDLQAAGILVNDGENCKYFTDSFYQWFIREKVRIRKNGSPRVEIDIPGEIVHISTSDTTSEMTRQAARFFVCLYNKKGTLVLLKELLKEVLEVDEDTPKNMNKLYQVKKIVSEKISHAGMAIVSNKSKGSQKGYTLTADKE